MKFFPANRTGAAATGSQIPLQGRVRNLEARPSGYDGAELRWAVEGVNTDKSDFEVSVDGDLVQRVPAGTTQAAVANLATGDHALKVIFGRPSSAPRTRHGDLRGSRVWLSWPASPDESTASYEVYGDLGSGDELLATLSDPQIQTRISARPDTGTGRGRVSVSGGFVGTGARNHVLTFEVTAVGEWDASYRGETASGEFGAGDVKQLWDGVFVSILDDPEDYDVGDSWDVRVGPALGYLTDALEPGTYTFTVRAMDGSGNPSDPLDVRTFRVIDVPDELPAIALAWDDINEELSVSWGEAAAITAGVDSVRVYANWATTAGAFMDYVCEEVPLATLAVDAGPWTFDPGAVEGELLFYLRPVTDGIEREDLILHRFTFPVTPESLGYVLAMPTRLEATAIAGGDVRLEWDYYFQEGDDAAEFRLVASDTDGSWDWETPWDTITATQIGGDVVRFSAELGQNVAAGGLAWATSYLSVRAAAADGTLGPVPDSVSVVPDDVAPTFTGQLRGTPQ